ncbi:MAG TPA: S8 family serine peptidase [Gammaproteobacteria bacterium]
MRCAGLVASLALIVGCASPPARDAAAYDPESGRQILLTVHQDEDLALQLRGATSTRYLTRRGYGPSPAVERILNELAQEHGLTRIDGWLIASLDAYCEVFAVAADVDIDRLLTSLNEDPRVELAQRMNVFETQLGSYDDPYADLQESVLDLEIAPAHELATGRGVTIAVIDSGIDAKHPDLHGRVSISRNFVAEPRGEHGEIHGTAIAGIIASQVNNNEGIVGVAPNSKIAALRACWAVAADAPTAHCSSFSLALALEAAMNLRVQVINMSLTGPFDALLGALLDQAVAHGMTVVAAAADSAATTDVFPASHAGVIAAQAATGATELAPGTLQAPANEILTTTPDAGYAFLSGNSLAAAHVTGVIALLLERAPMIEHTALLSLLEDSTNEQRQTKSISACRALAHLTGTGDCAELSSRTEIRTTR